MSRPGWHGPVWRPSSDRWPIVSAWACWSACRSLLAAAGKADLRLAASGVGQPGRCGGTGARVLPRPGRGRALGFRPGRRHARRRRGECPPARGEPAAARLAGRGGPAGRAEPAPCSACSRSRRSIIPLPGSPRAIVGNSGGSFVQALLLDAGTEQGVAIGMPAIDARGSGRPGGRCRPAKRAGAAGHRFQLADPGGGRELGDHAILEGDNSLLPDAALPADESRLRRRRSGPDLGSRRRAARRA